MRDTGSATDAAVEQVSADERPYYQVVFIWQRDPETFGRYQQLAAPVVRRYGGALERQLVPDAIFAEGMRLPDIVNIVYCDNREAFRRFGDDPDFQSIVHLRTASIDMAASAGLPIGGTLSHGGLEQRLYLVEIAQFDALGAQGYAEYEAQAEPLMGQYGYHVERKLAPEGQSGFPFQPNIVKVAYFDGQDGLERWHQDAAHQRVEQELYPAAVQQSIWLTARVHPQMLARDQT